MVRICLPMHETQLQPLGQEDLVKKEMATHSSILTWEISWTEEPGRLQSMGSQRVGHDLEQQKQALTVVIIRCVLETASDTMGKDRPGGGQSVFSGP